MKEFILTSLILNLFSGNTNVTTDQGLSDEMKTYYSDYLIDLAGPKLVHDQFGQKQNIPQNGGKEIEFRKYDPLPKALTPLTEGVTPDGQKISMSVIKSTVDQYGGYAELSDVLMLTAIDKNIVQATKLIASQAGRTLDTITREVLNGGTNVLYSGGVLARHLLVGGNATASNNHYLKVDDVKKAVRALKVQNADPYDDSYVGIIHPDASYDLTNDPEWKYPHQYVDTEHIYNGEIGKIANVRFVETSEAKIFHAPDLTDESRTLKVGSYSSKVITLTTDEACQLTAAQAAALVGRKIIAGSCFGEVAAATAYASGSPATAATITLKDTPAASPSANDVIYPGEAGAAGRDVYSTLIIGADAYGVTEVEGGGLQHIVKQLGSAGTADPLDQRATTGWKAMKTAERLVEQYMVRIESASTFEAGAN